MNTLKAIAQGVFEEIKKRVDHNTAIVCGQNNMSISINCGPEKEIAIEFSGGEGEVDVYNALDGVGDVTSVEMADPEFHEKLWEALRKSGVKFR